MKKLLLAIVAFAMATSVSAQTVTESKTLDNVYIGINGGVATKTTGHGWLGDLDPNFGVRVGRYFTPVFGLAVESNAYFSNKPYESTGTIVRFLNTSLLGTINLSNWFGGYKGEPRSFEVVALYGYGWGHSFNSKGLTNTNNLTSKAAVDLAFNFGSAKAWQVYVEPAIVWALNGDESCFFATRRNVITSTRFQGYDGVQYNINRSMVQLNVGLIYKFKNSNGTHNFTIAQLRDQSEIDGLNAQINGLRNDLNNKDSEIANKNRKIANLQKELDDCNNKPESVTETAPNLQQTVFFRQGKSKVDALQYAPIELVANYMKANKDAKVEIKGYASPEGSKKLNQKLSEARAEAVKDILVKKYKIAANRLSTKGMGATNKLFEQVEFNRVATFNDDAK